MVGGHRYESLRFYLVGEAEGHRLGEGKAPRPDGTEEEDHRLDGVEGHNLGGGEDCHHRVEYQDHHHVGIVHQSVGGRCKVGEDAFNPSFWIFPMLFLNQKRRRFSQRRE